MRRSSNSFPSCSAASCRARRQCAALLSLFALLMPLTGCGLFHKEATADHPGFMDEAPQLLGTPLPYTTRIHVVEPIPGYDDGRTPPEDDLIARMRKNSQLIQLAEQPPDSLLGLERRARVDQGTAVKLLHSLGYYDGEATFAVDESASPAIVTLTLTPGQRYLVGSVTVRYEPAPVVPGSFLDRTKETGFFFKRLEQLPGPVFPRDLKNVRPGDPAQAAPMLDAVAALPTILRREGYPLARVASARYTLDKARHELNAAVIVDPGPAATMDGIAVSGLEQVHARYLERLVPWKSGTPWDADLVAQYRETLQQLGLFTTVDVKAAGLRAVLPAPSAVKPADARAAVQAAPPDTADPDGPAQHPTAPDETPAAAKPFVAQPLAEDYAAASSPSAPTSASSVSAPESPILPQDQPVSLPVDVVVRESAFRTVGASMRYATDVGFGVQGSWEHRNLFGNGELLKIKMPIAQDLQGIRADFEKPAFGRANQKLLAGAALEKEKTDAYTKTAASAYTGLERRLTPIWWADARVYLEDGSLKENSGKNQYRFLSFNMGLRRDTRNNVFNPTSGSRVALTVAPFTGSYDGAFTVFTTKVDATAYYAPMGNDSLVLAGRLAFGGMVGSSSRDIPASLRYYAGGGGSVRGYAYQALGPRDAENDPLGGSSFQEINLEARFKVTDTIGIVPFVDAGMVYETEFPKWGRDLDWAVGLGLRYFTPIGPIRFDVAFPLTHIRDERRFQLYISIGQAF